LWKPLTEDISDVIVVKVLLGSIVRVYERIQKLTLQMSGFEQMPDL